MSAVLLGQFWALTVLALLLGIISIQLSYLVSSAAKLVIIQSSREKTDQANGSSASVSSLLSSRHNCHKDPLGSSDDQAALAKLLKGFVNELASASPKHTFFLRRAKTISQFRGRLVNG